MFGTDTATLTQSGNFPQVSRDVLDNMPAVEFSLPLDEPAIEQQPDTALTFEDLCRIEPRLATLYNEAKSIRDDKRKPSFCANRTWYACGSLRERTTPLVGCAVKRRGGDPRLATSRAYDTAYHTIYDALPDCRNCVCYGFQQIVDERMGRNKRRYY